MPATSTIRKLTIRRFRGREKFDWLPKPGMNFILGGGDVGKTTVLEAIALLLSPSNASVVSIGVVRLSADERNDRDLRLVYGSALDRLLADGALRARIGKRVSELDLHEALNPEGKEAIEKLDGRLVQAVLPGDLKLGLTVSAGVHRRAYDSRKRRIKQKLTTDNHKDSLSPWVSRGRILNEMQLATFHNGIW